MSIGVFVPEDHAILHSKGHALFSGIGLVWTESG